MIVILWLCMHIYICIHIYIYNYILMYIVLHIYIMVLGSLDGFCFGDQTQAKPLDGCIIHIMVIGGGLIPKMAQEIARSLQSGPRHEM